MSQSSYLCMEDKKNQVRAVSRLVDVMSHSGQDASLHHIFIYQIDVCCYIQGSLRNICVVLEASC